MINKDRSDPSRLGFLIDLDLATKIPRQEASGAPARIGTRAFMSIGVLWGNPHSFMDDLESFFWVLCWICIHYIDPYYSVVVKLFENWNYVRDLKQLAMLKLDLISSEIVFHQTMNDCVTDRYLPLIPCLRKLRKLLFPGGEWWDKEDPELYAAFQRVLLEAQRDLNLEREPEQ